MLDEGVDTILPSAEHVLHHVFGFDQFRDGQEAIIDGLISGEDQFVLMPTGGGKSLCYQVPALVRSGVAIVVSPLISLMQDQVNALRTNGVRAAFYNSSLGAQEARQVLSDLHEEALDILYVAPERLMMEDFLGRLESITVSLIAIDEAHCVSGWGHDFRPEYIELGRLRNVFPDVPMIALTATADKPTRQDILKHLHLMSAKQHVASFSRPNIRYTVLEKHQPFSQLQTFLRTREQEAGIVYCATRSRVEEVASKLASDGWSVLPYHAGLKSKQRTEAQEKFQKDDIQVVVATVAFGMGIDKSNVRFVVHYDIPKNIEAYYQETGRSGRDGLAAEALLLYGSSDVAKVRGMIEMSSNDTQKRIEAHKLNAMVGFAEAQSCRRRVLLGYFGEAMLEDCGNCDNCLSPPDSFDGTVAAQKVLSCVYRLNQRFGMKHVIDVLRGAKNQRIAQFGHESLSTYGIGQEYSAQEWSSIVRQLIHRGFLEQDIERYSILKLTPDSRKLLRGEDTLHLAKPRVKVAKPKAAPKTTKTKRDKLMIEDAGDQALFETLRALRKQLADDAGVPPFVIFSDASLIEMALTKPANPESFLAINGVGQHKLEKYGDSFMKKITLES